MKQRRGGFDVTNTVNITDPRTVRDAVVSIVSARYPQAPMSALEAAFDTFGHLYSGTLPGYLGCDTWYHDAQHSLDCALAMARLMDGHDADEIAQRRLGPTRTVLGVILALFHDAGYIRRETDADARNGAEFTLYHVGRSAEFLQEFLPQVGMGEQADLAAQLVHFTGYEIALDQIRVRGQIDRKLGYLLGTADLIAQLADRSYLEKCRSHLYREFELCGLAGKPRSDGPKPIYSSPDDLIRQTPKFVGQLFDERLDGYFGAVYRHAESHFSGANPYLDEIQHHLKHVRRLIRARDFAQLRRRPRRIHAPVLRRKLGLGKAIARSANR